MSVTPSSSKPPDPRWDYDVYVSFKRDKTNYEFLDYLFPGLERNGIFIFHPPIRGENIPTLMLKVIQRSRIFMVVLSQEYISSEYCLNELVEIMHRRNIVDHIFFPILYQLGPSDVEKRIETLEEAFPRPEEQFGTGVDQRMQGWRAALTEALNSSDQMLHGDANYGSMGILKFVEEVLDVVCTGLNITRNTLRMDSCVEMMIDFLNLESSEIYIVGMSCMDETLKKTLIDVVYRQLIRRGIFERASFKPFIRGMSTMIDIQEQLLGDMTLRSNKVNIENAEEGISLIEKAIQGKIVLIVLDGVADDLEQLHTLVGNSNCIGPGSRVIAITRDTQLRTELEAHGKHKVEDLHDWKSPQLFIWRASMMAHPVEDFSYKKDYYLQLKNEGHDYEVKFNPDANLYLYAGEGSEKQITLEPDEEVVFDKEAFEMTLNYMPTHQTLDLSGTSISSLPKYIFRLVSLKRLILGGCSYFKELPPEVGELQQLEVLDLEGTKIRDLPPSFFNNMCALQTLNLSKTLIRSLPKSIVRLVSLKRLILRYCFCFKELPPEVGELKQLEFLDLEGTNIRNLPPSFFDHMHALQTLNLSQTGIRSLPKSIFGLVNLKSLILRGCQYFEKLPPEAGELLQLEVLDLEYTNIKDLPKNLKCPMLLELNLQYNFKLSMNTIPPSFFKYMPALQILNLSNTRISSLPKSIFGLVGLKRLIIRKCYSFEELPSEVGELKQLEFLDLEGTTIRDLPENLRCPMLLELHLYNVKNNKFPPSFFDYMIALQTLNLSCTKIRSLPKSIVKLVNLKSMNLSRCLHFMELPPEVEEFKKLEVLHLEDTKIWILPDNLRCPMLLELYLHNNSELTTIPLSFFNYMPALQILNLSNTCIISLPESIVRLFSLKTLILSCCDDFVELPPEVGELEQLEVLDLEGTKIRDLPENLRCPMLLTLKLHNNKELSTIPPSFFNYMPALQILNLSKTGIRSLPKSIVRLVSLKILILSYSDDFVELPPEVGELEQLEVLDLEGTKIRDLPKNLRCPMLLILKLHNNKELSTIPPSFFNYMSVLQILNLSKTCIRSLPESIDRLVRLKRLILSSRLLSKVGDLKQIKVLAIEGKEISDLHERVIDLEGKEIMDLSVANPSHPESLAMFLNNNHKLKMIPPSFSDYVPALQVLNLSRTGIRSLPKSIFRLVKLKILILSYCHCFSWLSPKVGQLKQLEVLDLEGTKIMNLPKAIKKLSKLTCLNLSFEEYMGDGSSVKESDAVVPCGVKKSYAMVPRGVIKALLSLEELIINVNPDDKWWNECVEDIITEVCNLKDLDTLFFYFPRVDLVRHFLQNKPSWVLLQSHFRFIVGHHVKRILSRRPRGVELELVRWARCLEYINGDQAIPEEIKKVLQYSTAFFLERHATVKKLSDFGIENMKQLKCCVVGECNEVEVIIDETDAHEEDVVLGSLEYLCIYYMKNLRRIWEGPIQPKSLSLLKFLTLRTCPELTTVFTVGLLDNLYNLEELTIDDCPSIQTLVSCEVSAEHKTSYFLLNLKRISLHYMPGLFSISSGLHIAPRLEWLSLYNCPNLKNLLIEEVSSKDLKIEGERSWWDALEWRSGRLASLDGKFFQINIEDC